MHRRVGVFLDLATAFGRNVLEGVAAYSQGWELLTEEWGEVSARNGVIGGLDGIIAAITNPELARATLGIPCVNVAPGGWAPNVSSVLVDPDAVGRVAAQHFVDRGLRHLAWLGENPEAFVEHARRAGCSASVVRWDSVLSLARPAGLFVTDDLAARRILRLCRAAGIRTPEDLAVLAPGTRDLAMRVTVPALSSIILPSADIGYQAARLLHAQWVGLPLPEGPVLLPPTGVAIRESSDFRAVRDTTVAAALHFIEEHLDEGLCVNQIAAHVNTSRRWLEVKFMQHLGRGPASEIRRAQLERARKLLLETDWPLKQISSACGLTAPERLHVLFKRQLGVAPGAYRRRERLSSS